MIGRENKLYEVTSDERGGMTAFCMLVCLLAVYAYIKFGHAYMTANLPWEIHVGLIAILALACLFTSCCQIHLIFKGEQSPRQIRRSLRKQLKVLSIVTKAALERLAEVENTISWQSRTVRPIAFEHGSRAQEVITRIIHRGREVETLIAARNKESLFLAAKIMRSPLGAFENCQDFLIKSRPIPALLPDQWIPTLEQLLQATEFEVERAEARIRQVDQVKEAH